MTDDNVMERFYALVREADRVNETEGVAVDSAFDAVLSHIIAHPGSRSAFTSAFLSLLRQNSATVVVAYCMHALRWPEVREQCTAWLASEQSERVRYTLRGVIESFEDSWFWSTMYDRFRAP